jgi:hypothetical protein
MGLGAIPMGYTRTTQRAKYANAAAKRYSAWKEYVWAYLLQAYPKPPRLDGPKIVVGCYMEFADRRRPDPGNVVKGIVDALADRIHRKGRDTWAEPRLFTNDKNMLDRGMDFTHLDRPGVLVVVSEI